MARPHQPNPSASSPLEQDDPRSEHHPVSLDAFVSTVYLPHIRLRKRSWRVDERIAGSICPPPSETGSLRQ